MAAFPIENSTQKRPFQGKFAVSGLWCSHLQQPFARATLAVVKVAALAMQFHKQFECEMYLVEENQSKSSCKQHTTGSSSSSSRFGPLLPLPVDPWG